MAEQLVSTPGHEASLSVASTPPMRVLLPAAPCASRGSRPAPPRTPRHAPRRAPLRPPRASSGGDNEPDLITKLVGMVFGKQVLEDPNPAGLKRMTKTDWPDQYPPVVGEDAAPVEGDAPEVASLRPLLKQTQLEFQPLALAYDAERDGWSAAAFHEKLDGLGAAVLVLQTAGGAVCGGYNPKGWLGYGDWRDAISAFLFTWPDGDMRKRALKLPKTVRTPPGAYRRAQSSRLTTLRRAGRQRHGYHRRARRWATVRARRTQGERERPVGALAPGHILRAAAR